MVIPPDAVVYVDSSVFVRSLMADESDHDQSGQSLASASGRLLTSAITQVEVAGALRAAATAGRVDGAARANLYNRVFGPSVAPLVLLATTAATVALATAIADRRPVRALDAVHIATALTGASEVSESRQLIFLTLDHRQADAARAEGLDVVVP